LEIIRESTNTLLSGGLDGLGKNTKAEI
jgi:hypothetical protein